MLKIYLPVGLAASGKSTWAREEVRKDPEGTTRINRDDLRNMMSNYHFTDANEKLVTEVSHAALRFALKRNRNVIMDETNLNERNFEEVCKIARQSGKDCMVIEKPFYIDLEEALERNSKREGTARVPDEAIKKMWRKSGGKGHKHYKPRIEVITGKSASNSWEPIEQDESLPRCVVFDNDGTISLLNGRNPYDASTADQDLPHKHVIEVMKLYHDAGYKILFVSGREEKDREPTEKFYQLHFPEVKYELFMRPTGNMEKDVLIKSRIYETEIKGKYFVAGWYDDRLQICQWLYSVGLPLFRVNDPEATF